VKCSRTLFHFSHASHLTATANFNGLSLASDTAVTLNGVKASFNTYDGIYIDADGKVSLSCSSTLYNSGNGLYVRNSSRAGPAAALKLQSFRSYMNGTDEDIQTVAPVLRKPCRS
jgi:hypothetical protein